MSAARRSDMCADSKSVTRQRDLLSPLIMITCNDSPGPQIYGEFLTPYMNL